MASKLGPAFAYTVVYVKDVAKSVDFYAKAFGYHVRQLDESHRAVENRAVPASEPEEKEWGQRVGYLRDIDGLVVQMGSFVRAPKQD